MRLILALIAVLLASACTGVSPGARFEQALTGSDRMLMEQAAQESLEGNKVGQGLNWSNQDNGHLGTVMPTRTYKNNAGQDCREYRLSTTIDGQTRFQNGARCRQPGGGWVIVRISQPPDWHEHPYPYYGPSYGPYYGYPHSRYRYRRHHGVHVGLGYRFGF